MTARIRRRPGRPTLLGVLLVPISLTLTVGSLSGCKTTNTYSANEQIITDGWLSTKARVEDLRTARTAAGHLEIQATVYNDLPADRSFDWRIDWIDARGMTLQSPLSGWQRQQVPAKGRVTIGGIAPDPKAEDFRLQLIQAK